MACHFVPFSQLSYFYGTFIIVRSLGTNIGKVEIEKKNKETEGPREEGFVQLFFSHARPIGGSIQVYAAHILLLRSMNNSSKIKYGGLQSTLPNLLCFSPTPRALTRQAQP